MVLYFTEEVTLFVSDDDVDFCSRPHNMIFVSYLKVVFCNSLFFMFLQSMNNSFFLQSMKVLAFL